MPTTNSLAVLPQSIQQLLEQRQQHAESIAAIDATFARVIVTNLGGGAASVTWFYNGRGTAEQCIKEGKLALNWTRLSCHDFVDNQVRLQLFALAYNLGNFLRRLALPTSVKHWTLTTLRDKLIKIGCKVVHHARQVVFQLAEVAVPRSLFAAILRRIRQPGRPTLGVT
jgi:hypothetical protein